MVGVCVFQGLSIEKEAVQEKICMAIENGRKKLYPFVFYPQYKHCLKVPQKALFLMIS